MFQNLLDIRSTSKNGGGGGGERQSEKFDGQSIIYDCKGVQVFDIGNKTFAITPEDSEDIYNMIQSNLKDNVIKLAKTSSGIVVFNVIVDDAKSKGLRDLGLRRYFEKPLYTFKEYNTATEGGPGKPLFQVLPKKYHKILIATLHNKGIGSHEESLSDGTKVLIEYFKNKVKLGEIDVLDISINGRKMYHCNVRPIRKVDIMSDVIGYTVYNGSGKEIYDMQPHSSKVITYSTFRKLESAAKLSNIPLLNLDVNSNISIHLTYPLLKVRDANGNVKPEYKNLYREYLNDFKIIDHSIVEEITNKNIICKTKEDDIKGYLTILANIIYNDTIIGYVVSAKGKAFRTNMIRTLVGSDGTLHKSKPLSDSITINDGEVQIMTKKEIIRLFTRLSNSQQINNRFNYTLVKTEGGNTFIRPKDSSKIQKIRLQKSLLEFSDIANTSKEGAFVLNNINIFGAELPLKYFE